MSLNKMWIINSTSMQLVNHKYVYKDENPMIGNNLNIKKGYHLEDVYQNTIKYWYDDAIKEWWVQIPIMYPYTSIRIYTIQDSYFTPLKIFIMEIKEKLWKQKMH